MRRALTIGINNYPGTINDLNGCLNDCENWSKMLNACGFHVTKLQDSEATRENILNALSDIIGRSTFGDYVVFTYSGHGSQKLDYSGDELDGYDETLYVYDGHLVDDELREILNYAQPGVHITVILDSCHSGTATRKANPALQRKIRFFPTQYIRGDVPCKKKFLSEESMIETLLTGCKDNEYSCDAYINGSWQGAFSHYALKTLNDEFSYKDWHSAIRLHLPNSNYPQSPQLEGSTENKNRIVFGLHEDPDPVVEEIDGFFKKYWLMIAIVVIAIILITLWVIK